MMIDNEYYIPAPEDHIKRERNKARELRGTPWWRNKLNHGYCEYCQNTFASDQLTMDHRVPVSRGGQSTKGNVVVSCKSCNTKKGMQTPAEMVIHSLFS